MENGEEERMNIYQYFYKPRYETVSNCTGLFGFMGDDKDDYMLAGIIQAKNEHQAEAKAREKKLRQLKKHFDFVTDVEITKVIKISR